MVNLKYNDTDMLNDLIVLSKTNGYITTKQIFNAVEKESFRIEEVDGLCDELLDLGIIIKDDEDGILKVKNTEELPIDYFISNRDRLDYKRIFDEVIAIDPSLNVFIRKLKNIPPPYTGEQDALINQILEGNRYARERLIEIYLKVVVNMALKFSIKFKFPIKDAIQDGNIGLITAIDRLSQDNMKSFTNSVQLRIHSTIFREDISICQSLYIPVYLKEKLYKIVSTISDHPLFDLNFNIQDQQPKLTDFLCKELSENSGRISILISLLRPSISLDDQSNKLYIPKTHANQFKNLHIKERRRIILKTIEILTPRERIIIKLRTGLKDNQRNTFGIEWPGSNTLEEIGAILGVTRERIRQIEKNILNKLRHPKRSNKLKIFYE